MWKGTAPSLHNNPKRIKIKPIETFQYKSELTESFREKSAIIDINLYEKVPNEKYIIDIPNNIRIEEKELIIKYFKDEKYKFLELEYDEIKIKRDSANNSNDTKKK